jgi:sugar phosphate isomerase/epimerase
MPSVRRRSFLLTLGAGLAAPAIVRSRDHKPRMPISFSTLGCPDWTWKEILDQADALGYAGVEIRGLEGEMDLPKWPGFQGSRLEESKADLAALGLLITDLGASSNMHLKEPRERQKSLDEGRRFIDLAASLGAPYVRMFGDKIPPGEPREEVMKRVVEGFREMAGYARAAGVGVVIESHGDFTRSADLEEILTRVRSDAFMLCWDAHHTFVSAGEAPADTWKVLGRWVRHTHLKDSVPHGGGRRYVLTGTGAVPVREQVKVLAAAGYDGFYGFEWEKKWHPEIEPPEVAFPHYAKTVGGYLLEAGVRPS